MTPRTVLLALVTAAVAATAIARLQISYDLAFFLPQPADDAQRLLLERLGQGPGAQLIFVELPRTDPETAARIAGRLRDSPHFGRVLPESSIPGAGDIPTSVWHNRLLLGDLPDSEPAWRQIFEDRLDDASVINDSGMLKVIAADPALLAIDALLSFSALARDAHFRTEDAQYLLVETAAPAFDLGAQGAAVDALRRSLANVPDIRLYGSGVYGTDLQAAVRSESTLFSTLASLVLAGLVWWRFRSANALIGIALPLLAGGSGAMLVLTLLPGQVHGITLAFGFTLLGVAIDYPLHLFTHLTRSDSPVPDLGRRVWPTLRLGIASTLIAYGAFLFSGAAGLQQLGIFAVTGVTIAALSSAWLTGGKAFSGASAARIATEHAVPHLRHAPWVITLLVTAPWLMALPIFDDDLASLTPVDPALLARDATIRQNLGVADIRHLVAVRQSDLETVLRVSEQVSMRLDELRLQGVIRGVQTVTPILPSENTQRARRQRLADPELRAAFVDALAGSPFQPDAFAPFLRELDRQSHSSEILTLASFEASPDLHRALSSQVYRSANEWVSLIYLQGLTDVERVDRAIDGMPGVTLVDLKQASVNLVAAYRYRLLMLLAVALALIAVLLSVRRSPRQSIWLLGTVAAAACFAALASHLWQSGLSLFDLMALTLVAGLGLDYALFFSKATSRSEAEATHAAVQICALSSLVVFGILSFSTIPVLRGIGTTVALGVTAAYVLSRYGRQAKADI